MKCYEIHYDSKDVTTRIVWADAFKVAGSFVEFSKDSAVVHYAPLQRVLLISPRYDKDQADGSLGQQVAQLKPPQNPGQAASPAGPVEASLRRPEPAAGQPAPARTGAPAA